MCECRHPPYLWPRQYRRQRDRFVPSFTPFLARFGLEALSTVRVEEDTGAVPRSDSQALPPLGRNGLSSSDGRFCENRPFAHSGRFCGHKGRIAIVTDVGAGCDGRELGQKTNDMARGRRSRVVLTPRRWRQVSRKRFRGRWWQTSPVTKESTKETVK